ncbi:hypothetical protein GDO81_015855 [Engystomops pustulosus]|uniref:Uncharacterized protein n=1 Tax=Engystomops pustulosus TaxID=76066 RepID=A0AAV7AMW8_ENGPU|nr:hypothetical protein GDO81_015855 [Engystomops pustulosus]
MSLAIELWHSVSCCRAGSGGGGTELLFRVKPRQQKGESISRSQKEETAKWEERDMAHTANLFQGTWRVLLTFHQSLPPPCAWLTISRRGLCSSMTV